MGQRVSKAGPNGTTRFIYAPDGSLIAEVKDGSWTNYIRSNGEVLGLIRGNALYYVHNDQLGRPEVVTNAGKATTIPPGPQKFLGTGRRKTAVARVRLTKGNGIFQVNGRDLDDFFVRDEDRQAVLTPMRIAKVLGKFDVHCTVNGGGFTGQSGGIVLGIARALLKAEPDCEPLLRAEGLLTRDARMKERKKYGQRGARARFQFSKR